MLISSAILKFQFHYGTIKSVFGTDETGGVVAFQFHYGTIKSF